MPAQGQRGQGMRTSSSFHDADVRAGELEFASMLDSLLDESTPTCSWGFDSAGASPAISAAPEPAPREETAHASPQPKPARPKRKAPPKEQPRVTAGSLAWDHCAIDAAGVLCGLEQCGTRYLEGVSLTRDFLRDESGKLFWFKTWRCPEVTVVTHPSMPLTTMLRLRLVVLGEPGQPVEDVCQPGAAQTDQAVVAGATRFTNIAFQTTSFNLANRLFHVLVQLCPTPGRPTECWLSAGVRVLSKRKVASGAPSARESRRLPPAAQRPAAAPAAAPTAAPAAGGSAPRERAESSDQTVLAQRGRPPAALIEGESGPLGFYTAPNVHAHHPPRTTPVTDAASPAKGAAPAPSRGVSPAVRNLHVVGGALPPWLFSACALPGAPTLALTLGSVSAAMLHALADEPAHACDARVEYASDNLDEMFSMEAHAIFAGRDFLQLAAIFDAASVGAIAEQLRAVCESVAATAHAADETLCAGPALDAAGGGGHGGGAGGSGAGGSGAGGSGCELMPRGTAAAATRGGGGTEHGAAFHRYVADCAALRFKQSAHAADGSGPLPPAALIERALHGVLYYDPVTRRLTLLLRVTGLDDVTADARLREALDSSVDWFKQVDARGYVVFASAASIPFLGFEPFEFIGSGNGEQVHPEDEVLLRESFRHELSSRTSQLMMTPPPSLAQLADGGANDGGFYAHVAQEVVRAGEGGAAPAEEPAHDDAHAHEPVLAVSRARGNVRVRKSEGYVWTDFVATLKWHGAEFGCFFVQHRPSIVRKQMFWARKNHTLH